MDFVDLPIVLNPALDTAIPIATDSKEFFVIKAVSSFLDFLFFLHWKLSAYSSDTEGCLALNYPLGKCITVRAGPVSVLIDEWIGFWR